MLRGVPFSKFRGATMEFPYIPYMASWNYGIVLSLLPPPRTHILLPTKARHKICNNKAFTYELIKKKSHSILQKKNRNLFLKVWSFFGHVRTMEFPYHSIPLFCNYGMGSGTMEFHSSFHSQYTPGKAIKTESKRS